MKGIILLIAAASLVVLVALAGGPILERHRRAGDIEVLRTALERSRMAADSCRMVLGWEQEAFLDFNRVVDSLRNRMESFEDPEQGGVPQEIYGEYLESFERYNDSVAAWQARADSLRAMEAACRALVEAHNYLGDSIRRRREALRAENR